MHHDSWAEYDTRLLLPDRSASGYSVWAVTRVTITITVTTRKRELDSARGWLVYAS
jgi:hypothetical protein